MIPKKFWVLFVCFFVQGNNILMAENAYRYLLSKDKMEKMKMSTRMIIQNGINIFVNYLWYCISRFLYSQDH